MASSSVDKAMPVLREIATDRIHERYRAFPACKAIGWNTAIPAPTWARIIVNEVNDAYQEADAQVKAAARTLIELTQDKEFLWDHLCKMEANPEDEESIQLSELFRRANLPTPSSPETELGISNSPAAAVDAEENWGESAEDQEYDKQLAEVTARAVDEARAAASVISQTHKRPRIN